VLLLLSVQGLRAAALRAARQAWMLDAGCACRPGSDSVLPPPPPQVRQQLAISDRPVALATLQGGAVAIIWLDPANKQRATMYAVPTGKRGQ
jgi:hypothetical protein